jgi:hypothetical protein
MRVLPTIDGYTIDYRLREFRRAALGAELRFVPFRSEEGRAMLEKVWEDKTLVVGQDGTDPDAWVCVCGNRPTEDGFFPCNRSGEHVEPTIEAWPEWLYSCDRCGRIIDSETRAVVSLAA